MYENNIPLKKKNPVPPRPAPALQPPEAAREKPLQPPGPKTKWAFRTPSDIYPPHKEPIWNLYA